MPDVTLVVMYLRNLPFLRSSTQSTPFCSCDHTTTRARGATVTRRLPAVKMADRLLRLSPCTWREFARVENIRCRGVGRCFDLGWGRTFEDYCGLRLWIEWQIRLQFKICKSETWMDLWVFKTSRQACRVISRRGKTCLLPRSSTRGVRCPPLPPRFRRHCLTLFMVYNIRCNDLNPNGA